MKSRMRYIFKVIFISLIKLLKLFHKFKILFVGLIEQAILDSISFGILEQSYYLLVGGWRWDLEECDLLLIILEFVHSTAKQSVWVG